MDEEIAARQKHRTDPTEVGSKSKFERKFIVTLRTGFSPRPSCDSAANSLRSDYPNATLNVEANIDERRSQFPAQNVEYASICRISVTVIDEF